MLQQSEVHERTHRTCRLAPAAARTPQTIHSFIQVLRTPTRVPLVLCVQGLIRHFRSEMEDRIKFAHQERIAAAGAH